MPPRYRRRAARKAAKKAKNVSFDRTLMKLSGKLNNRIILKHGLQSQGIEPANTANNTYLTGPDAISSQYTGGPLTISNSTSDSIFSDLNGSRDFGAVLAFSGADIRQRTSIWPGWDQFRFVKVQIKIECLSNFAEQQQTTLRANTSLPTLYYAVDRDDASIPPNQSAIVGKSNYKMFQFSRGKTLTINIKPTVRKLVYTTATSAVGYEIAPPKYLDTNNGAFVPHYGLKMWFADVQLQGTGGGHAFRFTYNYWLEYRSPINNY